MKPKIWNILVLLIVLLTVGSFLFLFVEGKVEPRLVNIPFAFWTGFLVTILVVFATYLGSRFFPFEDPKKR